MVILDLYFGRSIPGGGRVAEADWQDFAANTLTPAFPDGFSVFDLNGQWRDPATGAITQEPARLVRVAIPTASVSASRVDDVTRMYRTRFHQHSVGVVSADACGVF